jgi:threonine/homoserine/homoserine lactone efflux protein
MDYATQLGLFFAIVFGVVLLPGMDMAFVLASALNGGRRQGLAAVGGIVAGSAVHVIVGTTGVAIVLALVPAAFNVLLMAGAAYVAWIGFSLMRSGFAFADATTAQSPSSAATFRRAALTNLLNPKAYVFMLAVFPQFLLPQRGAIAMQALVLGLIIAATQVGVYGAIALIAARARGWLQANPAANLTMTRAIGAMLIAAAVFTGIQGWRR